MNTLSILLYAADISDKIGNSLSVMGILAIIFSVMGLILLVLFHEEVIDHMSGGYLKSCYKFIRQTFIVGVCLFTVSSFIPKKDTVYMIAASELSETVVTNPEFKEIMSDIRKVIQSQIKKEK